MSLGSNLQLTINEIVGATLSIPLQYDKYNTFESIVRTLQAGKFKTTSAYTAALSDSMDDMFSKLTFHGKGFAFGLLKTRFAAQFLRGFEFLDPDLYPEKTNKESASKVFADKNLELVSSDFNYILGLVFGGLNIDNNIYECNFEIRLSKEVSTTCNLNNLLSIESKGLFGKDTDLKLRGIDIDVTENIFDSNVLAKYSILGTQNESNDKSTYDASATFKIKRFGPINLHELVNESVQRLNSITRNITEGLHE